MKTWRFCRVEIAEKDCTLLYLCDETVQAGDWVQVPLGTMNELVVGKVCSVNLYDENEVPYPVEKTKSVIRKVSPEEVPPKREYSPGWAALYPRLDADLKQLAYFFATKDTQKIYNWACRHHECIDSPQIMAKVVECYEYCLENGMPVASLNLGTLYYLGTYLPQDFKRAAELYEIAAQLGELRAICNLGYCHYYGRHQERDYAKAYEYFLKGALLFSDENCLYKLGDMYLNGYGIGKDPNFAYLLYGRAYDVCDCEDPYCLPDIEFRLGKCAFYGIGCDKNLSEAREHLENALEGFINRSATDPFVASLIEDTKKMLARVKADLGGENPGSEFQKSE